MSDTTARPTREAVAAWREQEMFLLQEVMKHVGAGLHPEAAIRELLHLLSELLGLNRGRVVLEEAAGGRYAIRYAYGLTREEMARGRYARGEGITGRVIGDGHLVIAQDIDKDPHFLFRAVPRARLPPGPVSFLALPIRVHGRIVGALASHRRRQTARLLADDVTILRIAATLIGQLLTLHDHVETRTRALEAQNHALARALEAGRARYGIVGASPALLAAIAQIERVAAARAAVLLLGASGSGKELFARALHLASPRRDRPFIKVNCAAIPETLFESELFGHRRGAFTGAVESRAGYFEQADGGTLFLDEVGELPLLLQTKLLRTLQEGTVMRLGSHQEVRVDVRLVTATNRDLGAAVARGLFREDLFYRLNVLPITLPTLAERREDIPELVAFFLSRANQTHQTNIGLTAAALAAIVASPWPGNVRQLSNFIERLVLLARRNLLDAEDIAPLLREGPPTPGTMPGAVPGAIPGTVPGPPPPPDLPESAPPFRPYRAATSHPPEALRAALERSGGNKSRAAQLLGLTERQFSYRWRKLGPR